MAKRIQRKRTKGWKMPPNTVYVGRGSKWGNPFTEVVWGRYMAIEQYRNYILDKELLRDPHWLDELRGKDLACWCRLDQSCHADLLLRLAEKTDETTEPAH